MEKGVKQGIYEKFPRCLEPNSLARIGLVIIHILPDKRLFCLSVQPAIKFTDSA